VCPVSNQKNRGRMGVDAFDWYAIEIGRIAQEIDDRLLRVVRRHCRAFDLETNSRRSTQSIFVLVGVRLNWRHYRRQGAQAVTTLSNAFKRIRLNMARSKEFPKARRDMVTSSLPLDSTSTQSSGSSTAIIAV